MGSCAHIWQLPIPARLTAHGGIRAMHYTHSHPTHLAVSLVLHWLLELFEHDLLGLPLEALLLDDTVRA